MLERLTSSLQAGHHLTPGEIRFACEELLRETDDLLPRMEFLKALHRKGESPGEIAGFVEVFLEHAVPLPISGDGCLDVCGTGGDRAGLFNVSTATMLVAAACGARVVKHGNRGITSRSGGADVLEALGVGIHAPPEAAAEILDRAGCCFLFAPNYHPAFKAVAPVRKALADQGLRSIFNMLGPLLNPVRPAYQLAGVFDPALLETYASVFVLLGRQRAWAVHGMGPNGLALDEISPLGSTRVVACEHGEIERFSLENPSAADLCELLGGDAAENAQIIRDILEGRRRDGARQIVEMNAGAALVISGLASDPEAGRELAAAALDSGAARRVLERLQTAV